MEREKHLTIEDLNQIMFIKAVLNKQKISYYSNIAFPNIIPISRPEIKYSKIKSLHWLADFMYAEGCFFITLKKNNQAPN